MIDKIQAAGTYPNLTWFGSTGGSSMSFPYANHRDSRGVAVGGNFLYEDGSVIWRKFDLARYKNTIDIGSGRERLDGVLSPRGYWAGPLLSDRL